MAKRAKPNPLRPAAPRKSQLDQQPWQEVAAQYPPPVDGKNISRMGHKSDSLKVPISAIVDGNVAVRRREQAWILLYLGEDPHYHMQPSRCAQKVWPEAWREPQNNFARRCIRRFSREIDAYLDMQQIPDESEFLRHQLDIAIGIGPYCDAMVWQPEPTDQNVKAGRWRPYDEDVDVDLPPTAVEFVPNMLALQAAGKMHILAGYKMDRHGNRVPEFQSQQAAWDKIARVRSLYKDKVEHSGAIDLNIHAILPPDKEELLRRAIEARQQGQVLLVEHEKE